MSLTLVHAENIKSTADLLQIAAIHIRASTDVNDLVYAPDGKTIAYHDGLELAAAMETAAEGLDKL